jgi:hypothetical protein
VPVRPGRDGKPGQGMVGKGRVMARAVAQAELAFPLGASGQIDHWLVAGPFAFPVPDLDRYGVPPATGADAGYKLRILRDLFRAAPDVTDRPVEGDALVVRGQAHDWRYVRCGDDHQVDLSTFCHTCHHLVSYGYAVLETPAGGPVRLVLDSNGPADLWVNGEHAGRHELIGLQDPARASFAATLRPGRNDLLVRFEGAATRACPHTLSLRLDGITPGAARILLPTIWGDVARRQGFEALVAAAYCTEGLYAGDVPITVRWEGTVAVAGEVVARLLDGAGAVRAEGRAVAGATGEIVMARSGALPDGPYRVVLTPTEPSPVRREIAIRVHRATYAETPEGMLSTRRREALELAARQHGDIFAEIARVALGRWDELDHRVVQATIDGINQRRDCSDFYLVGLLGLLLRHGDDPAFPPDLHRALRECVLGFKYWMDEPGADAMCYWTENHQILFFACAVLAGRLYPDETFVNSGRPGRWHRDKGLAMAREWCLRRGAGGFVEWDSNVYFEEDLLALSHLCDFCDDPGVRLLAEMTIDKLAYQLAVGSYRGVFGSSHGRTYVQHITGARLEATSGIGRLLWGLGGYNGSLRGLVALACCDRYRLPAVIERIARDQPAALWSREHGQGAFATLYDAKEGEWAVDKVTFKTPDGMLCSAQDWLPGDLGVQQHIWQATLGPDAVVFGTHPACSSTEGSRRPGYWHGNYILPRVAQHRESLIALYRLPEGDRMGFTHAYFPLSAFDEYELAGGWAFARRGDGYLALTARCGVDVLRQGEYAYRELRSYGARNAWLCLLGRRELDGDFAQFRDTVLALPCDFGDLAVRCTDHRGRALAFAWDGPLTVDGVEVPITGFARHDSPYCTRGHGDEPMTIRHGGEALTLDFARGWKISGPA